MRILTVTNDITDEHDTVIWPQGMTFHRVDGKWLGHHPITGKVCRLRNEVLKDSTINQWIEEVEA